MRGNGTDVRRAFRPATPVSSVRSDINRPNFHMKFICVLRKRSGKVLCCWLNNTAIRLEESNDVLFDRNLQYYGVCLLWNVAERRR
jgi:hypothetical protein